MTTTHHPLADRTAADDVGTVLKDVVIVVFIAAGAAVTGCAPLPTMAPLEAAYGEGGAHDVVIDTIAARSGQPFRLYRPELTSTSGALPVVVWGSDIDDDAAVTADVHAHLASHGFVVVDSFGADDGSGTSIAAGIAAIVGESEREGSPLRGLLDVDHVGVAGVGMGAAGALNAQTDHPEGAHIATIVAMSLPAPHWCSEAQTYEPAALTSSLLLLGSSGDQVRSPWFANQTTLRALPIDTAGAMATTQN
ncbi:MAG TPA: hypothetical protein VGF99_18430, partial [Myxococcota bacterium]